MMCLIAREKGDRKKITNSNPFNPGEHQYVCKVCVLCVISINLTIYE